MSIKKKLEIKKLDDPEDFRNIPTLGEDIPGFTSEGESIFKLPKDESFLGKIVSAFQARQATVAQQKEGRWNPLTNLFNYDMNPVGEAIAARENDVVEEIAPVIRPQKTEFPQTFTPNYDILPDVQPTVENFKTAMQPTTQVTPDVQQPAMQWERARAEGTQGLGISEVNMGQETMLSRASNSKFASFMTNPYFIRFLAEAGGAIAGKGTAGEAIGQATIGLQRGHIYDQALSLALEGKSFEGLPINLLSVEERASLDQQRLTKLKTEAEIAKLERDVETEDITRGEELGERIKASKDVAHINVVAAKARQGETGAEISDDVIKDAKASLQSEQGIGYGKIQDTGQKTMSEQVSFLRNFSRYPAGEARIEAKRFFDPPHKDLQVGEYFWTVEGIYIKNPEGSDYDSDIVRSF